MAEARQRDEAYAAGRSAACDAGTVADLLEEAIRALLTCLHERNVSVSWEVQGAFLPAVNSLVDGYLDGALRGRASSVPSAEDPRE